MTAPTKRAKTLALRARHSYETRLILAELHLTQARLSELYGTDRCVISQVTRAERALPAKVETTHLIFLNIANQSAPLSQRLAALQDLCAANNLELSPEARAELEITY